ncbi:MAG: hypothetical protein KJ879_03505 [Nanoarchaeota archaeon]|nr:hypothetical protein [Nanoarchaeota archaeon]
MKRGRVVLISFSLVLVLSLSLVSAGWFSDFFGKMTGRTVLSPPTGDVTDEVWEGSTATVSCSSGSNITSIKAYYYCPGDAQNRSKYCSAVSGVGQQSSTFTFTNSNCDGDPCVYIQKKGILAATCSAVSVPPADNSDTSTVRTDACSSDFDDDGTVAFADYILFAAHYGEVVSVALGTDKYDLDSDGTINFGDYVLFAQQYGKECVAEAPEDEEDFVVAAFSPSKKEIQVNWSLSSLADGQKVRIDLYDSEKEWVRAISTNVLASLDSYSWSDVDIPEGIYRVKISTFQSPII